MDLYPIRLELLIAAIGAFLLLGEIVTPSERKPRLAWGALFAFCMVFLLSFTHFTSPLSVQASLPGSLGFDNLSLWAKRFSILATALTMLISIRYMRSPCTHLSEFLLLQISACLGMMLVSGARDFLTLFISLELITVSFYLLVSFEKGNILCLEAGLKYLIYGGVASGIMLYGMALIYGATGAISFKEIHAFAVRNQDSSLLITGMVLLLVGVAFKISAAPFHWWTPDVYEGSPTPTTALLSLGSKTAGFIVLFRTLFEAFPSCIDHWMPLIYTASMGSILIGNLGALSQSNLKRLMGYSSISHTGYLLLGIAASSVMGLTALLYYLLAYLLANALIFIALCETGGPGALHDIRDHAGLGDRSKWMAAALTVGLLSLSGIPPLAGFFGKFLVLGSVIQTYLKIHGPWFPWLLGSAILGIICSLYFYLNIIRTLYFTEPPEAQAPKIILPQSTKWVTFLLIGAILLLGLYQSPWMKLSKAAANTFNW